MDTPLHRAGDGAIMRVSDDSLYELYEFTVGEGTAHPRIVWGISCIAECECPACEVGEHRVDAYSRGSGHGWYETVEEAQEVVRRLNR